MGGNSSSYVCMGGHDGCFTYCGGWSDVGFGLELELGELVEGARNTLSQ